MRQPQENNNRIEDNFISVDCINKNDSLTEIVNEVNQSHVIVDNLVTGMVDILQHGLFFLSDISVRGINYPNVTHVVQIRLPPFNEAYIH